MRPLAPTRAIAVFVLLAAPVGVSSLHLPEEWNDDGYFDPMAFVNITAMNEERALRHHRRLDDRLDCYNPDCPCFRDIYDEDCGADDDSCPCCIACNDLTYCTVLQGMQIEDKYYPDQRLIKGSCVNLDDRVERLQDSIFGQDKTFRDTDACRDLVNDYICLWWGSENTQYDNRCANYGEVMPCRSFCVQVGMMCANNPDWLDLCYNIECPPEAWTDCYPGPVGVTDFECIVYQYESEWINGALSSLPARGLVKATVLALSATLLLAMLQEEFP